jgi:hypothetical protein
MHPTFTSTPINYSTFHKSQVYQSLTAALFIITPPTTANTKPAISIQSSAPVCGVVPETVAPLTDPQKQVLSDGQAGFRQIPASQAKPAPQSAVSLHFLLHTTTAVELGLAVTLLVGVGVLNFDVCVGATVPVTCGWGVAVGRTVGDGETRIVGATVVLGVTVGELA